MWECCSANEGRIRLRLLASHIKLLHTLRVTDSKMPSVIPFYDLRQDLTLISGVNDGLAERGFIRIMGNRPTDIVRDHFDNEEIGERSC